MELIFMLLHAFKAQTTLDPHKIFAQALQAHPDQVFSKNATNVNNALKTHKLLEHVKDKHLTMSQLWQGEKWKGERPQDYTHAIVAAAVIPGTFRKTAYGEVYDRVSIQPSWLTGQLVVVKEETHADDLQKKMVFLGRKVADMLEAKNLLINALLEEHFSNHSSKTQQIFGNMTQEQAVEFLNKDFEKMFLSEQPALFHVEHGLQGTEEEPFETWNLVRLAASPKSEAEIKEVGSLKEMIANSISTKLYTQTIAMHEKKQYGLK